MWWACIPKPQVLGSGMGVLITEHMYWDGGRFGKRGRALWELQELQPHESKLRSQRLVVWLDHPRARAPGYRGDVADPQSQADPSLRFVVTLVHWHGW